MTASAGTIGVRLLGATSVTRADGTHVTKFGGVKPRQLLGLLASDPGTVLAKERMADLLWDGAPPPGWVGTLESYVCLLRRALGSTGRQSALRTVSTGYVLDADLVSVDAVAVRRLLAEAGRTGGGLAQVRLVERAVALADRGELLASEAYAAWAVGQRTRFSGDLVSACVTAAEIAHRSGDRQAAIALSQAAVARDGLAEAAWKSLMAALAADDRHGEALRAYAQLRAVLNHELGIEPSPACREIYLEVLRSRPAPGGHRGELATLMRLMRQALEGVPGLVVPSDDDSLSRVACGVLARTA